MVPTLIACSPTFGGALQMGEAVFRRKANKQLADPLQYRSLAKRIGVPLAGTGKHRADRPGADHARTILPDFSMGAVNCEIATGPGID